MQLVSIAPSLVRDSMTLVDAHFCPMLLHKASLPLVQSRGLYSVRKMALLSLVSSLWSENWHVEDIVGEMIRLNSSHLLASQRGSPASDDHFFPTHLFNLRFASLEYMFCCCSFWLEL